ncbi:leucine-rich repeat protein [Clostridium senegalense]|uniref:cell wall-binding repeat-containing protein n=1 Tax=Clostridium senegalense TaxID=1465809 RepID=UPI001C114567|nr:cell wall-binding repeat-containing protein [Clostridium senegalense]MBU5227226.1 leucine-rich repeat protein [Clostridium senegalense]
MKKTFKLLVALLIGGSIASRFIGAFAAENNKIISEHLAGKTRFETAIEISNKFNNTDTVILINSTAISDAIAVAPLAKMKNAPILLTEKNALNEVTMNQIKKLDIKNIIIIGGECVISKNVEKQLSKMNVNIDRLGGENRYETCEKIIKSMGNVEKVAIVNGYNGLADGLSIAAPASRDEMAIVLSDGKEFVAAKDIVKNSKSIYIIGGESVISEKLRTDLNGKRVSGCNRIKTNSEVIREFYNEKELETLYIAKDGSNNFNELIDALTIAPLSGMEKSPVQLVGDVLDDSQKNCLKEKIIKNIVQVGHGIKRNILEEIVNNLNTKKVNKKLEIESVKLVTNEKIIIKLGCEIKSIDKKSFYIEGGKVNLATLSKDRKTIELGVSGLVKGKEYIIKFKNLNGEFYDYYLEDVKIKIPNKSSSKTSNKPGAEVPKDDKNKEVWEAKYFTFEGNIITGFSELGKEKLKTDKDIILPNKNEKGEKVTTIGDKAFFTDIKQQGSLNNQANAKQSKNNGINSIIIPDTITTIGNEAFRNNCLTSIKIPKAVTTIGMLAFNNNMIKELTIPENVINVGNGAFALNYISKLNLPSSLKTIPVAFAFNELEEVTIPEGVVKISDMAFSDNKISKINLPSTLTYLSGFNNNNFSSIDIPKTVTELGQKAFARNKIDNVVIPGNVKKIGKCAFQNTWHDCFINSLTIEDGVEFIENYAFSLNHLKDVYLPNSIKSIKENSFNKNLGYDGLVHLYTVDYKNKNFLEDSKYHVIDPAKVVIRYICNDKVLKEVEMWKNENNKYFHIGDKDIEIPVKYEDNQYELKESIKKIDKLDKNKNIFLVKCGKKEVVEDITIKSIGDVAPLVVDFKTSKDKAVNGLPKKTFIVDSNKNIHYVDLDWKIDEYDGNIPGEYSVVGTFVLPNGVVNNNPKFLLEVKTLVIVKENMNSNNDSSWDVEDFNFEDASICGFSENGFQKLKTNKNLVLPNKNQEGKIINYIKSDSFKDKELESLVIPEGLDNLVIGTNAFQNNNLSKVIISNGVKEIDAYAFEKNNLKYIDFPSTLKKIGNNAFANNKLVSANFSEDIEGIALDRFSFYNNRLTSITIFKEVKKVHEEAFKDNKGCSIDNKVKVFTLNPEAVNNNNWFPTSKHHKIVILGVESIEEVNPMEIELKTDFNNINLQSKIILNLNNGYKKEATVTWIKGDYNCNKSGEYLLEGYYDLPENMDGEKPKVTIKIIVRENIICAA